MKVLLVLLAISGSALADDRALLHCRTIADVAGRVACYDAIPVGAAGASKAAAIAAPGAMPAAVAPAAPTAAAVPAASAPAASADAGFGMETIAKRKTDTPSSIESTVVGKIEGWGPNTRFTLANGQVWRVVDGSSEWFIERTNPRVVLSRNAIGTIFFEVDGAKQPPRVRRVQ
ncbi:hypothetical protein SAMN05428959_103193 [Duganella sp. CF517]|uniref:hypothetical protein n=1 Tax=Duganella sp. CF517 TaxID=1881038 RepID=UPI0008AAB15D|nr:hypothetical protein [Duganella sp. CF517]SEN80172.1 hypothetical protein SAMN05428959_103193 [Duganella sp. CF517]